MNRKKCLHSLSFAVAAVLVFAVEVLASFQRPDEIAWKPVGIYYHRSNKVFMYYDPKSIAHSSQGFAQIMIKQVEKYDDEDAKRESMQELIDNRKFLRVPTEGYSRYSYSTSAVEFDCKKKLARTPCVVDYDDAGGVLGKHCSDEEGFAPVVKRSISSALMEIACNKGPKG